LHPSNERLSATVVASDCLTANALSTAAAVLGPVGGTTLARTYGLDHLFFAAATPSTPSSAASAVSANSAWPAGFQVTVAVALKSPDGGRYKRPYVAVWVETPGRKVVRTLSDRRRPFGHRRRQPRHAPSRFLHLGLGRP
jgi:hypothetical protein